jgi:hypothetical protein
MEGLVKKWPIKEKARVIESRAELGGDDIRVIDANYGGLIVIRGKCRLARLVFLDVVALII